MGGMALPTPGIRFVAAFNNIENHLRTTLHADKHIEFAQLVHRYAAEKKRLPAQHLTALLAFASLRNAISHGRYYGGRPIADPVEEVVEEIERLWKQISSPPLALTVVGGGDVCQVHPDEPIRAALDHVQRFDYSQLPVYDESGYVGILTTNTIARWLADQLSRNAGLAAEEPVRQVMRFAEKDECAALVPRAITAAEAIDRLSQGGRSGQPVTALIISQFGRKTDKPLAVVVPDDLPTLTAAVAIA
jgi:CBS domain-containing protein